jgi:hypothetical protein
MMKTNQLELAQCLMRLSPGAHDAGKSVLNSWNPEQPPPTVLFSAIGKGIVRCFDLMPEDVKRAVFKEIETGMKAEDEDLMQAVATGVIEGMIAEADKAAGLWEKIEPYLEEVSHSHATGWRKFAS